MIKKTYAMQSEEGLHARPAMRMAQLASTYKEDIDIIYKHTTMTLKSIIGIMSLGIPQGDEFTIRVSGKDEENIMKIMHDLLIEEGLVK